MNIYNIPRWLNAGMETPAPMITDILNNALFYSSPRINQTLHQILHALHCFTLYSLLNAPDFVVNWIEVRALRRPQIWKSIYIYMKRSLKIIALSEWRQGNPFSGGVKYTGVRKNFAFSTNISLFLETVQDRVEITMEL